MDIKCINILLVAHTETEDAIKYTARDSGGLIYCCCFSPKLLVLILPQL